MIRLDDLTKSFGPKRPGRRDTRGTERPEHRDHRPLRFRKERHAQAGRGSARAGRGARQVDGETVQEMDREQLAELRGRMGYVFQFAALFDSMTVAENIRLGLIKRKFPEEEIGLRIAESLDVVGLSGSEDGYPAELSGGMRKRVGIARAIALKPRYILYDEPTTGLDPVTSAVMDQLIDADARSRRTGLVVTHDMHSAFTVGDRVAMLYEGVIRQAARRRRSRRPTIP